MQTSFKEVGLRKALRGSLEVEGILEGFRRNLRGLLEGLQTSFRELGLRRALRGSLEGS